MADADYEYRPMSVERRARLSAIHRKRWGAPDGYATVRGVHVPFEHRDPLRYWANWISAREGETAAHDFVAAVRDGNWKAVPRIRALFEERQAVHRNRELLRRLEWEAQHAD